MPLALKHRIIDNLITAIPVLILISFALGSYWYAEFSLSKVMEYMDRPILKTIPALIMRNFNLRTFDTYGNSTLKVEGELIKQYPESQRVEFENFMLHFLDQDNQSIDIQAKLGIANDKNQLTLSEQVRITYASATDTYSIQTDLLKVDKTTKELTLPSPFVLQSQRLQLSAQTGVINSSSMKFQGQVHSEFTLR